MNMAGPPGGEMSSSHVVSVHVVACVLDIARSAQMLRELVGHPLLEVRMVQAVSGLRRKPYEVRYASVGRRQALTVARNRKSCSPAWAADAVGRSRDTAHERSNASGEQHCMSTRTARRLCEKAHSVGEQQRRLGNGSQNPQQAGDGPPTYVGGIVNSRAGIAIATGDITHPKGASP